jgi:hypothetical protein
MPKVLIDRDLVIRAANPAFLRATGHAQDNLLHREVFDAFPDNPDNPDANGVERLGASFEQVLRTGTLHNMVVQRYDILNERSGEFTQRHWVPVNSPICADGRVVGIAHQAKDVTVLRADVLAAMEYYRDVVNSGKIASPDAENHQLMINAFTDGIAHYRDLADEVVQLREALSSRATIEQAKGMLMLSRRCSAEEAFDVLRGLSQNTNVRLAEVAAALIYQLGTAS